MPSFMAFNWVPFALPSACLAEVIRCRKAFGFHAFPFGAGEDRSQIGVPGCARHQVDIQGLGAGTFWLRGGFWRLWLWFRHHEMGCQSWISLERFAGFIECFHSCFRQANSLLFHQGHSNRQDTFVILFLCSLTRFQYLSQLEQGEAIRYYL